ncbi:prephenate dehydrogenase/arogenate dehydrogenase family protein [Methanocella sp. CWC-04]|uniref:Prephenate dehydrogenase/arogenate dehydrogenase family protein n=1 Tax=Methanooceanicella nereidis TaxID=2052831 RepID=A0AAP2W5Z0_9EURY|nr:prephenate dehydrogenase/arogenate dehydrogenase family protein [Methanocella sp. CWC-04]MCD1294672.1 prephenate dehydrogenase/arogenate dehydrogenase family protein [Methanocella sp. CWC-04]
MSYKVLIIGGAGGMGRWCAKLFKRMDFDVSISSRRDVADVAKSLGVGVSSGMKAGDFDIVVLSVPIDTIDSISADIAPFMKPGSLLMDLSSLKKEPMESMTGHTSPEVEVLGAHPLFGPEIDDMTGYTIVLVPSERCKKWFPIIHDTFEKAGANIEVTTADDHDQKMAIVQGLTHFVYIALGRAYERIGINMKTLDGFATPVYRITKDFTGRVLSQDPRMYALIQSGKDVVQARSEFIIACSELESDIMKGDIDEFVRTLESATKHYGDTAVARKRTQRIIERSREEERFIRNSVGTEQAFAIEGEKAPVYGIIKEASGDRFVLDTPSRLLDLSYDEVTLLSGEELKDAKAKTAPRISRYVTVKLARGANAKMLKWVLKRIDGVAEVRDEKSEATDTPDIYRFTLEVYSDDSEKTLKNVLDTIWGLGYEVK